MTPPDAAVPSALVHEGLDGWLFLQGGSNYVTALYRREGGGLPDTQIEGWRALLEMRAARCRDLGIACAFVVVPDKLSIYGDRQAAPLVDPDLSPALRLAQQMANSPAAATFVDLIAPMRARRHDADLFWRTDTHWTPAGCLLAYQALCERLSLQAAPDLLSRPSLETTKVMDLGGRVDPMQWEAVRDFDFARDARRAWTNRVTRYLENPLYEEEVHVGARARFDNPGAPNDRTMLLFGDSFSRPASHSLTGMLAETVRSLEFIWSSSIDWSLVRSRRPDVLVFEIAERFLALLPDDRSSLWMTELRQEVRAHKKWIRQRRAARAKRR